MPLSVSQVGFLMWQPKANSFWHQPSNCTLILYTLHLVKQDYDWSSGPSLLPSIKEYENEFTIHATQSKKKEARNHKTTLFRRLKHLSLKDWTTTHACDKNCEVEVLTGDNLKSYNIRKQKNEKDNKF